LGEKPLIPIMNKLKNSALTSILAK